jgi:hypothetical protein
MCSFARANLRRALENGPVNSSADEAKTPPDDDKEAETRFRETLGRLATQPPKLHKDMKKGRGPKPAPK